MTTNDHQVPHHAAEGGGGGTEWGDAEGINGSCSEVTTPCISHHHLPIPTPPPHHTRPITHPTTPPLTLIPCSCTTPTTDTPPSLTPTPHPIPTTTHLDPLLLRHPQPPPLLRLRLPHRTQHRLMRRQSFLPHLRIALVLKPRLVARLAALGPGLGGAAVALLRWRILVGRREGR